MLALRAQQSITNWGDRSAYVFDNASRYLSLVQLHTTTTRPIQLHDQLLFLQAGAHPFIPDDPWGSLFLQRHYQYHVVQISNDVLHCDFVELFYAPANTDIFASDIVLKMHCTYSGTYLLRASKSDTTSPAGPHPSASVPHQLSASSSTSILRRSVEVLSLTFFDHCRLNKHRYYLPPTIARYRVIFIGLETTTPILMIPDKLP